MRGLGGTISALVLGAATTVAVGCGGGGATPCKSDADCKGDRICVSDVCIGADAGSDAGVPADRMDSGPGPSNGGDGDIDSGASGLDSGEDAATDTGAGDTGTTDAGNADSGPLPECGNSVVEAGEDCDDGFTDSCGTCNADCSGAGTGNDCGDGDTCPEAEACDDGVANSNTYGNPRHCNASCTAYAGYCGDGNVSGFEFCDEGIFNGDGYALAKKCNTTCSGYAPYCGDSVPNGSEACDTGATNGDSYALVKHCNTDCVAWASYCGDGTKNPAETCDDGGNNGLPGSCAPDCAGMCAPGDPGCFYPVSGVLPCAGSVETWTAAKKYYGLTGDVQVPVGCTLTIEPGVIVRAWDDHYLQIDGTLIAVGTPADLITFEDTSVRTNVAVSLDFMLLQGSEVLATKNLSVSNSEFVDSLITWSAGFVTNGSLIISGNSFDCIAVPNFGSVTPVAIQVSGLADSDGAVIEDNTVANCGTGIQLSSDAFGSATSSAQARHNTITACTRGVYLTGSIIGSGPTFTIEDNTIEGNGGGIEAVNNSNVVIGYNTLSNNTGGRRVGYAIDGDDVSYGALYVQGGNAQVSHNEISGNRSMAAANQVAGIYARGPSSLLFSNNNIVGADPAAYVFYAEVGPDINAESNYWGVVVTQEMVDEGNDSDISVIYDYHDHFSRPHVDYSPWLALPEPMAGPRP